MTWSLSLLLETGYADVEQLDNYGESILDIAVRAGIRAVESPLRDPIPIDIGMKTDDRMSSTREAVLDLLLAG